MLDTIDFSKMKTLGAGGSNVCYTNGKIAVKFGDVDQEQVDLMIEAAEHELSVPVLYYQQNVQLSNDIMQLMYKFPRKFYYNGYDDEPWPVHHIKKVSRANVLVMPYAKPLMRNDKEYTEAYTDKMQLLADEVANKYFMIFNKEWGDDHPWNLGYYRQNLVILDF